ncbi:GntR family transcriptional regulator [Mesotoga sp. SC_3PWM13N19]|nr:GntR family transcriptional regulator [Mesotoga sp. SC_3PWM13N19]
MNRSADTNHFQGIQQQLYRSMRDSIVELEIPPGARLTIEKLKRIYGVSSTPVRGALHRLKEDGLVAPGAAKSFYVKEILENDVRKLFPIRLVLEKLALSESINRIDREIISNLIVRMRRHLSEPEETKNKVPYDIDYRLHREILNKCNNEYLIEMMSKISILLARMRNVIKYHLLEQQKDWIINEMEEHFKIAQSILEGDLEKASAALEVHLKHSMNMICSILSSNHIDYAAKESFAQLED